ncbi:MAG: acyl-CoA thioesterase [Rhodospirillaceae bacterium]|jgi:acyl-CoA thioester hydrolase|nr:acyl-CoA thioesterase [Rhodospirillaceae bacterium]
MSEWRELHRGVVHPWFCDQFGHMNVRYYAHFFDDAAFHIWPAHDIGWKRMEALGVHTVVARTTTEFLAELKAGDLITVRAAFTRLGTKSITYALTMHNVETDELHARQEGVEVFFDPKTRLGVAIPDEIRTELSGLVVSAE